LKELYEEGDYDFYHVSLVDNRCAHAAQRINQFNLYGFPTVYFDGGYKVNVGAGSVPSAKAAYKVSLVACESRPVDDIEVEMTVLWLGDATMDITVEITNNTARTYGGTLRSYVTELESSLNWKDSAGKLYTFPLLDWAFNEAISIPSGNTLTKNVVWVGADHNSGQGQNYANIKLDNIMVITAVFNDDWHQGYSYPPNQKPFDAYYPDETVGKMPATLWTDTNTVPEAGGTVNFTLSADEDNASRNYIVIGGTSGTSPGFTLPGGASLPVNWDWFSDLQMSLLGTTIFTDFMGVLGADGKAYPVLNVPPLPAGSAGLIMYFGGCCSSPFDFVSNHVEVEVVP
jgi:hypothetical protein